MKNITTRQPQTEPIIIADECGDTLWDVVLQQEVNACEVKPVSTNAASLLKKMDPDFSTNAEIK